jgi:two-component system, OmpR family, response regulator
MNRHIALIEDDEIIRANYTDILSQAGFSVDAYPSKETALVGLLKHPPDLVLLDITLNGERDAGFAICAELRRRSELLPIVFLTSHDTEVDKISGMRLGADDYITKDVSLDYLIVRLEALFRRQESLAKVRETVAPPQAETVDDVVFDDVASGARWRGRPLELPLTQYWILRDLYANAGRPRSHADLMRAAKLTVEPNTITAHVKAIRDEFRRIDPSFDRIRTERGRGYRWVPA